MIFYFIRQQCFHKPSHSKAKSFKIIPKDKVLIREWYEFEGASTYEYAHNEVKTSVKSSSESNLYNIVKKEGMIDKTYNTGNNYKKIQDDLRRLDTSIERIQEELKKSIEDIKGELRQSIGGMKTELVKLIQGKNQTSQYEITLLNQVSNH